MEKDEKVNLLVQVLKTLGDLYPMVERNGGNGNKVVFSMITTTFNNICEILDVHNNNTSK